MNRIDAALAIEYLDRMIPRKSRTDEMRAENERWLAQHSLTLDQVKATIAQAMRDGACRYDDSKLWQRIQAVAHSESMARRSGPRAVVDRDDGPRMTFRQWRASPGGRAFLEREAASGNRFAESVLNRGVSPLGAAAGMFEASKQAARRTDAPPADSGGGDNV